MRLHSLLAGLLVLGATAAHAQTAVPGVTVTTLTSMRPAGDDVTLPEGTVGWPGARYPTAPPLFAVRPGTTSGHLYGGFHGSGRLGNRESIYTATGLYSLFAGVSVYERLAYDPATGLFGRIVGTPVRVSDGSLYGVMTNEYGEQQAGSATENVESGTYSPKVGLGVVFRTDFDGTYPTVVEATVGQLNAPNGALVADAQDRLYGIDKGPAGHGRIFRIDLANGTLTTVHAFGPGPDGRRQVANDLVLGQDGLLYGVTGYVRGLARHPDTPSAASTPTGTLYRIDPADPSTFTVLHTFTLAEGEINVADNVTREGWRTYPGGVPFVTGMPGGDMTLKTHSAGEQTGLSSLVDGGDGYLYGGLSVSECYVYVLNTSTASALRRIERPSPLCGIGHWPVSNILQYPAAYPYHDGDRPYGAVYRLPKAGGPLQILHTFADTDGATPRGAMAVAADGAIYGTTLAGGPKRCGNVGTTSQLVSCGTIYRIRPSAIAVDGAGTVTNGGFEHVFAFSGNDGRVPLGVRAASDGRLYGVTSIGGSYRSGGSVVVPTDYGTVFQVAVATDDTPIGSASLVATPAQVPVGGSTTLTWITSNTTNCSAASSAGDWLGSVESFGSVTFTPAPGTYRYTLTCNVAGSAAGAQVSSSTTVYVSTAATAEDGNAVQYGNGGGGPLSPFWLVPFVALLAAARRR